MFNALLVHTNEIILKGGNRSVFERRLIGNLRAALGKGSKLEFNGIDGGALLFLASPDVSVTEAAEISRRVGRVFGVAAFMFARRCDKNFENISRVLTELSEPLSGSFKIVSRRRDKSFPIESMELSARLGEVALQSNSRLRVDVHDPDHEMRVIVERGGAFVSGRREAGAGGLPTGSSGRVASLLSGGIDSPVASWKLMRRGCEAVFVHFHSYPYVGRESLDKAERLAGILADWQGPSRLHLVPLADVQRDIAATCDESMRVVLYRRMMLRIAEAIAEREGCRALVTGDAVGQVASQTLDNLATVSAVAKMQIFRPLIGDDKEDIVQVARRIGTFETSIEPHGDCCSLFMPKKPATHASLPRTLAEEAKFDVAGHLEKALAGTELKIIGASAPDNR